MRRKLTVTLEDDIRRARDLHRQAIIEPSHYYVGRCVAEAVEEIKALRRRLGES
jgi:hypothetical protein